MTQYRVTLKEITIEADSAEEAAPEAFKVILTKTPNIYEVQDPASISQTITLTADQANEAIAKAVAEDR